MPTLAPPTRSVTCKAEREATANWDQNRAELARTQPAVADLLNEAEMEVEWAFARDGSITALEDGQWWAACSIPLLAGRSLLKTLEENPISSCILAPPHAGLVRAARERTGPFPVLFVIQPDLLSARMILCCHDFSEQIRRHRFWIVCGQEWAHQLEQSLSDHPGLATPTQFIRTRLNADETTLPLIAEAQKVFSDVLARRGEQVAAIQSEPRSEIDAEKILLVSGSEFRLWDFGGAILQRELADLPTISRFDTDDALSGSPLALVQAARECGSVVSANICRADCNQLVSTDIPWITWMTQPAAPPYATAGPRDSLILADPQWRSIAQRAGWPAERIRISGYRAGPRRPGLDFIPNPGRHAPALSLGIICDTRVIQIRPSIRDFSSHRLLWDLIEEELQANPLALENVDAYLTDRAGQLNIPCDQLDWRSFTDELIVPAYQQGLARILISAGLPVRCWGRGWNRLPEFASHSEAGEILTVAQFNIAVSSCSALVHCWPARAAHPIDALDKPVLHRWGLDRAGLLHAARRMLKSPAWAPTPQAAAQLRATVVEMIRH